jgi:hypothetical protein
MARFGKRAIAIAAAGAAAAALAIIPATAAEAATCTGRIAGNAFQVYCLAPPNLRYQAIAYCRQNSGTLFAVYGQISTVPNDPPSVATCPSGSVIQGGSYRAGL